MTALVLAEKLKGDRFASSTSKTVWDRSEPHPSMVSRLVDPWHCLLVGGPIGSLALVTFSRGRPAAVVATEVG